MSTKYRIGDQEKLYFVTFTNINWLDVFTRREYKETLLESFRYCITKKGMELYAWVIMPSHVHLIIGTHGDKMENILRDMKKFTSKKLTEAIWDNPDESRKEWIIWMMKRAGRKNSNNKNFQFWQQDNHPPVLDKNAIMEQKLDYIHNNPVESGFVEKPEDWLYSSARDYCGIKGLIEINLIE